MQPNTSFCDLNCFFIDDDNYELIIIIEVPFAITFCIRWIVIFVMVKYCTYLEIPDRYEAPLPPPPQ